MNFQIPFAILAFISFFKVLNWICFSWIFSGLNSAIRFSWIRGRPSVCCLNARSFPAFLLISCKVLVFSLFHSVNILPRLNFRILHSVILLPRFHVPRFLYIPSFAFAPWVRIFGTNLHRFEKFGLWRQRHLPHRPWKKGTYQKSFLGEKLRAFCRLHLIAKWSCFIYVISDLFCRMSILYFCIFFS